MTTMTTMTTMTNSATVAYIKALAKLKNIKSTWHRTLIGQSRMISELRSHGGFNHPTASEMVKIFKSEIKR